MKKNMGSIDRIIRILVAAGIVILYYEGQITRPAAIILGALALIFIATSFIGFCPLYLLFKISTKKNQQHDARN